MFKMLIKQCLLLTVPEPIYKVLVLSWAGIILASYVPFVVWCMENTKSESPKLDTVDHKVFFFSGENSPKTIPSWVDYMASEYGLKKSREVDRKWFEGEVKQSLTNYNNLSIFQ